MIELGSKRLADAVHGCKLSHALPCLMDEARVVERDAETARERRQQALIPLGKGVRPVGVLKRDHASRTTPHDKRDEKRRANRLTTQDIRVPIQRGHFWRAFVDHQRLPRLHDVPAKTDQRNRAFVQPLPPLDDVRERKQPACLVVHRDADDLRVEDFEHPIAHEVVDRLWVELPRDRRLHTVDQRQLRIPLPGLLEEARVLERGTDAAGQRDEQPLIGLVERLLAIDVLQRDDARRTPGGKERDEEHRLRRLAGDRRRIAVPLGGCRDILVYEQRLARLQHVLPEADHRHRLEVVTLATFDQVGEAEQPRRLVIGRDAHGLRVVDLVDLLADDFVDRLRVKLGGDGRLHAVDQCQLGVALSSLVNEARVFERDAETARERGQQANVVLGEGIRPVEVLQ